jgi:hypothetical protein
MGIDPCWLAAWCFSPSSKSPAAQEVRVALAAFIPLHRHSPRRLHFIVQYLILPMSPILPTLFSSSFGSTHAVSWMVVMM